jgi:hypothetical protein
MHRMLLVVVLLAGTAHAEDPINGTAPFLSAGLVLSGSSRGFTIGIEVSGGAVSDQSGGYVGAAAGFDIAPWSGDLPRHRAYLEAEGGWVAFGIGVGPAYFFDGEPVAFQVTPYASLSYGVASCKRHEPFEVVGAFYRYTHRPGLRDLHEGGAHGKALWFVNGEDDHGVCTH